MGVCRAGRQGRAHRDLVGRKTRTKIDRWERYDPGRRPGGVGALLAADEDTNGDGKRDKWETYEGGALKTAAFDENHDGRPDRRLTYAAGTLTLIESRAGRAPAAYHRSRCA